MKFRNWFLAVALAAIVGAAVGFVRLSDGPAPASAPVTEFPVSKITNLAPGQRAAVVVAGNPLYLYKPTDETWTDLEELNEFTNSEVNSFSEDYGVFAYWAVSTYLGCMVLHVPKGAEEAHDHWLGGYSDPCHNVSYDYAGRALNGPAQYVPENQRVVADLQAAQLVPATEGHVRVLRPYESSSLLSE